MKVSRRSYQEGGKEPLTNKQFRKNERFQSNAERDRILATRGAKSAKDLLSNLEQYDDKKDKRAIVKQLVKAGAIALGGVALSNLRYPSDATGMTMGEYIRELRRLNR